MPARAERTILKTGSSRTVALPPDWLRAYRLELGDTLDVIYDTVVIIEPRTVRLDREFLLKELDAIIGGLRAEA